MLALWLHLGLLIQWEMLGSGSRGLYSGIEAGVMGKRIKLPRPVLHEDRRVSPSNRHPEVPWENEIGAKVRVCTV